MLTTTLFQIFASQRYTTNFAGGTALNLYRNFLNDPQLNGTSINRIGPNLNFVRNSFGTYYSQNNGIQTAGLNTPRFDYSLSGNVLGLLIEPPSTNLVEYSTNFTGNTWFIPTSGISVTNNVPGVLAPDLTQTVTLLTNTTSDGFHVISWGGTPAPINEFDTSIPIEFYYRGIFIKKHTARYIVFSVSPETSAFAAGGQVNFNSVSNIFDFDDGTFKQISLLNTIVEPLSSGWYRVSVGRMSSNLSTNRLTIGISNGPEYEDTYFAGNANSLSGVYVWGAQAEKRNIPTSYIPTNGTQVSRAGDNVTLSRVAFGKLYNPDESTFVVKGVRKIILENNAFATFANTNFTKFWTLGSNVSSDKNSLTISTVLTSINTDTVVPYLSYKLTAGLKNNNFVLYQNNTLINTLTAGLLPVRPYSINQFQLGRFNNQNYLNGYIHEFSYWPIRLTNQQLSAL